ncbi:MAG TPA: DUF3231 family protein, partial [Bacillales bacterium]|nr:DUF3231 family protein [Bacillales bacterium]
NEWVIDGMEMQSTKLTSAEMGKLWAAYMGNTMGECMLKFYLNHVDDEEIEGLLENALQLAQSYVGQIRQFFYAADVPIPVGFTDDDVNFQAPRLFEDEFYLHYLRYLGKAGLSLYSVAVPYMTRKDVRQFFIDCVSNTTQLLNDVDELLKKNGSLMNTPEMPAPEQVDFVNKQSFLNDFFGKMRPLHGLETAHLYGNFHTDITSKALILGFLQGAKTEEIIKYLRRGKEINENHMESISTKLNESYVPTPKLLDHLVTTSTVPTFSEKLMVFHKIDMFSMRIRECANGMSVNGRKDIGAMFAKHQLTVAAFAEDGANLMIRHGWLEQPPEVIDREQLVSKQ